MSVRLEVTCEAAADAVAVTGEDPALGAWDVSSAQRLSSEDNLVWEISIPIPKGEFKLVSFKAGQEVWELFEGNRRFPDIHEGTTLKMKFGEPRIGVEVSAEVIEANARATRKLQDRQGSALQENIDRKGESAYYHAHSRHFEVPEDAKIISGPGLITGGKPVLLEAGAKMVDPSVDERIVWLKEYSWSDGTGKVKVYVPVPEGHLPAEGAQEIVDALYGPTQVDLTINSKPRLKLKIDKLNAEVKSEECTTRVEAHKNRIVLQLAKKRDTTWYSLTKK